MAIEVGSGLTGYRSATGEVTIPIPGSTLENIPAGAEPLAFAGHGRVLTYTVVYVPTTRFKDKAPYALAVIELDEGARLLALVDGAIAEVLSVDAAVRYSHQDEYGHHFTLG
jgi:uncharacterized OB-fold protein